MFNDSQSRPLLGLLRSNEEMLTESIEQLCARRSGRLFPSVRAEAHPPSARFFSNTWPSCASRWSAFLEAQQLRRESRLPGGLHALP